MAYEQILSSLPDHTTLIAISKTRPPEAIRELVLKGHKDFGENQVRELLQKQEALQLEELRWHFVGHLQRNKVSKIMGRVHLLHSLDSERLFYEILKRGAMAWTCLPSLLQVQVSGEASKGGWKPSEVIDFLADCCTAETSKHCPILGLMCIGTPLTGENGAKIREEFETMRALKQKIEAMHLAGVQMRYLSMGMSADYSLALNYGSNMVRIGTALFGKRKNYAE